MKKEKSIDVFKVLTAEERITREGGEKLRNIILDSKASVSIDFHAKPIASVSFWDESIAKLLLHGWTKSDIKQKIVLKNIHRRDVLVIEKLMKARS